jgi:ankyrin
VSLLSIVGLTATGSDLRLVPVQLFAAGHASERGAAPPAGTAVREAQQVGTALIEAVEHRDTETVRTLLTEEVDVNRSQPDGATALHWAAHWDDVDTADLLIRAGARVNAVNELGVSPLELACANGSRAMVERLLAAGANPNAALPTGETALMSCARTGNVETVRALLARGAIPAAKEGGRGQTALMYALAEKHAAVARVLIETGADVHTRSTGGATPLLFAARAGDLESARMLLAAGANVNDVAPDGKSALLVAAASMVATTASDYRLVVTPSDHEALAIFLLDNGADPTQADSLGVTALHAAVETGKLRLVHALLGRGANPNARLLTGLPFRRGDYVSRAGYAGATPFWLAAKAGDLDMMRALVAGGADPQLPTAGQVTPLMVAAGVGQTDSRLPPETRLLEAAKLALDLGADVNAASAGGQTALHGAASISADLIIQWLAEHGAKIDAKDKQGRTPLDIAESILRPRPSTAQLLRKLGADVGSSVR